MHVATAGPDAAMQEIDLEIAGHDLRRLASFSRSPGPRVLGARHEFFDPERLSDVVIGAATQRVDQSVLVVADGERQDGDRRALAYDPDVSESAVSRQIDIEDYKIEVALRDAYKYVSAWCHVLRSVACSDHPAPKHASDRRVVADYKNAGTASHEDAHLLGAREAASPPPLAPTFPAVILTETTHRRYLAPNAS